MLSNIREVTMLKEKISEVGWVGIIGSLILSIIIIHAGFFLSGMYFFLLISTASAIYLCSKMTTWDIIK